MHKRFTGRATIAAGLLPCKEATRARMKRTGMAARLTPTAHAEDPLGKPHVFAKRTPNCNTR